MQRFKLSNKSQKKIPPCWHGIHPLPDPWISDAQAANGCTVLLHSLLPGLLLFQNLEQTQTSSSKSELTHSPINKEINHWVSEWQHDLWSGPVRGYPQVYSQSKERCDLHTSHKILLCSVTRKEVTRCSSSYEVMNYSCLQGSVFWTCEYRRWSRHRKGSDETRGENAQIYDTTAMIWA